MSRQPVPGETQATYEREQAMGLKLVETLYEINATDVVGQLRKEADHIEAEPDGEKTFQVFAIGVNEDGSIILHGWGRDAGNMMLAVGAFQTAAARIAAMIEDHR